MGTQKNWDLNTIHYISFFLCAEISLFTNFREYLLHTFVYILL